MIMWNYNESVETVYVLAPLNSAKWRERSQGSVQYFPFFISFI